MGDPCGTEANPSSDLEKFARSNVILLLLSTTYPVVTSVTTSMGAAFREGVSLD
ncbi:hypothetical protein SAMN02745225_01263 [Ferrithrix thermotolerans DSM 19514]|uniref:Uncharacterized protein n=1 Tax=Ferrithrix thermotolerans DSM 19514 TaxID=1121881 RepID=A0A1M4VBH2_9ACTN|nr:hypothetical protein [Ferrithrix thermotolerans]SHE66292.1 hypothetical protein SAMN02745225_01263 [Ferrithrix thermotolerans DSM 19514]